MLMRRAKEMKSHADIGSRFLVVGNIAKMDIATRYTRWNGHFITTSAAITSGFWHIFQMHDD